jgi:hypothetical protein
MSTRPGPNPRLVEIRGTSKSLREWSEDPSCEVVLSTLKKRYAAGVRGVALLLRDSNAGRPRAHDPRKPFVRDLDARGLGLDEINERLLAAGHRRVTARYVAALTADYPVSPEIDAALRANPPASEWTCRRKARELGLPTSVVLRYRIA